MALCYGRTCICCSGCRCCRLPLVGWARTTSSAGRRYSTASTCCSAPSRFVSIIDLACLGERTCGEPSSRPVYVQWRLLRPRRLPLGRRNVGQPPVKLGRAETRIGAWDERLIVDLHAEVERDRIDDD